MISNHFISAISFPSARNSTQCLLHICQAGIPLWSYAHSLRSLCFKTFSDIQWYHKPRNHGKDDSEEFLTLVDTTEQNQKELLPWLDLCDNLVRLCSMTTSLGVDMITTGQP